MDTDQRQPGNPIFDRGTNSDPAFRKNKQEQRPAVSEPFVEEIPLQEATEQDVDSTAKETPEVAKETKAQNDVVVKEAEKEVVSEKSDSDATQPIEISIDNDFNETKPTEAAKETETEITEDMVKKFLAKKGIEVESLEDLSRKEALSEQVQKFKEFEEQTGRGILDFVNTQKDWSKESQEATLREFLKFDQPGYSDEDIEDQIKLWTVSEDDEDELSPKELSEKKLESKRQYNKALAYMQNKAKEFATPLNRVEQPQSEEDIAKAYKPYWDKRDKSIQSFNEVKMKLGDKEISLGITQEDKAVLARLTQSQETIFEPYILVDAKEGDVRINTDSLVFNQAWSIPQIRNRFISEIAKHVQSMSIEKFSRENRNVTLDGNKTAAPTPPSRSGLTVVSTSKNTGRRIGQPII